MRTHELFTPQPKVLLTFTWKWQKFIFLSIIPHKHPPASFRILTNFNIIKTVSALAFKSPINLTTRKAIESARKGMERNIKRSFITHYFFLTKRCAKYENLGQLLSFIFHLCLLLSPQEQTSPLIVSRWKMRKHSKAKPRAKDEIYFYYCFEMYEKVSGSFVMLIAVELCECEFTFFNMRSLFSADRAVFFGQVLLQDVHFITAIFCLCLWEMLLAKPLFDLRVTSRCAETYHWFPQNHQTIPRLHHFH